MGITRSEAIDVIESIMRKYEEDECICCDIMLGDEDYEALRLARDSLKTDEAYQLEYEKPEICEDCISKADALKLNVYAPIAPIVEGENVHWEEIILTEELRKLPSVLPKADNSVLEDIKAKISDMYPNYIDEKGYRMIRKSDVLNIIDYCMGK